MKKTKLFSLLAMLFVSISLTLGFVSCSSDDDDDNDKEVEASVAGEKFIKDIQAYQAIEANGIESTAKKLEAGKKVYDDYEIYKANKDNQEWREAFLKSAAKEDVKQYETLNNLLSRDYSSPTEIAKALEELSKLYEENKTQE